MTRAQAERYAWRQAYYILRARITGWQGVDGIPLADEARYLDAVERVIEKIRVRGRAPLNEDQAS
jgi:hypothetical protein